MNLPMRPLLLISALALATAFFPGAALAHVTPGHGGATCGGTAPATTACSTGDHLNTWTGHVELDFSGTGTYTGTLESQLTQDQGGRTYTLRCDFDNGASTGCATTGDLPLPGVPFRHDCRSHETGTTTPGGAGVWGCRIYHVVA